MYLMIPATLCFLLISQTLGGSAFGEWGHWGSCSKTCNGGTRSRKRLCNPPNVRDCGREVQTTNCVNDFCPGPVGVAKAYELVVLTLKKFYDANYPGKKPSGKFYQSIFDIQEAVAEAIISVDPRANEKTAEKRLTEVEDILVVAAKGGEINFARRTLGRALFRLMKKEIKDGLPISEIDKAASNFLDTLKSKAKVWKQVISTEKDSTLIFTIDTSGSMTDEISASKEIAKLIINSISGFKVDYILSPFNDPMTGPVTYKGEERRADFITDIEKLTASGGGDCEELAFKGMLDAIEEGPKFGSPMFVFTDASAKDDTTENMDVLKAAAEANKVTITFFTNLKGCGNKKGIQSYRKIAEHTSGQVLPLKGKNEIVEVKKFVFESLKRDTTLASGGSGRGRRRKRSQERSDSYSFTVDDGLESLSIPVSLSKLNGAFDVILIDPLNNTIRASNSLSLTRIFEVDNPRAGKWHLIVPRSVGQHKYSVNAVSKDAIEFAYNFMYQENPKRNSPPISLNHPIKGKKNLLIVRLGDVNRIDVDTLRVSLHSNSGKVLKSAVKLAKMDSDLVYSADIIPPETSFQVKLTGKTKSGIPFERISRRVSKATHIFLRPVYIGNAFTVKLGTNRILLMQFLNFGSKSLFTFSGTAQRGGFGSSSTKTIRRRGFPSLTYKSPLKSDGLKSGSTDRLSVSAVNKATGEKTTAVFNIMLV